MMRITIVGVDNAVGVDENFRNNLNLFKCGLPANFWAFQWSQEGDETGEVEYNSSMIQNDRVTEIPAWAIACIAVWQAKLDQEAAEEAARLAVNQMQQGE